MYRDKVSKKSNIASIVELFMMFLLLLVVIVVITMICMTTREQSLEAGDLTNAVICAENTAEATKYAETAADAAELLSKMDGVTGVDVTGDTVTARQGDYSITVTLAPEKGVSGTYIDETISVSGDGETEIYRLHTGSYSREGEL